MVMDWFTAQNPIIQALLGTLFTWFLTALGAGMVFFFKSINRKVLDGMLGFAAGVMIAASFWSLLVPGIEMAESILRDQKRVLACACLCEGEYGVSGLYLGVPCVLGSGGVERIIELELDGDERIAFDASVEHVRSLVDSIEL